MKNTKVIVFGTFDIIHAGHINFFKQALKYADKLIVVVAKDENVKRIKKIKLLYSEKERVDFLKEFKIIDKIYIGDKNNPYKIIKKEKPDIICLGYDQKEYVDDLKKFLQNNNIKSKVIRLKPYKKTKFKTHKIRKHLEESI